MKKYIVGCLLAASSIGSFAEEQGVVSAFDNTGLMSFVGYQAGTTCTVQWTSSLSDPTRTNWYDLVTLPVSNFFMTTEWPMYFRVRGTPDTNLANGLVAFYPFTGNANDASGNAHNGTVSNAVLTADRFGHLNSAYYFNGINGYVSLPASASLAVTDNTIAVWINMSGFLPGGGVIFSTLSNPTSTGGIQLQVDYTKPDFDYNYRTPSVSSQVFAGVTLTSGDQNMWKHLAATYQYTNGQSIVRIYINGILVKTDTGTTQPVTYNGQPAFIGINADSTVLGGGQLYRQFFGSIDDVRLYNRTLSSNEVYQLSRLPY